MALLGLLSSSVFAEEPPPETQDPEAAVNAELARLFEEDQADRQAADIDWSVVSPRDEARRRRVEEILAAKEARVGKDFYHAAMVFQHGQKPMDYRRARDLARKAFGMDPGLDAARWLSAAAHDRYLLNTGKRQHYGTQFRPDGKGGWELSPIDRDAVTDEERQALKVPTLAEMEAYLEGLNHEASEEREN